MLTAFDPAHAELVTHQQLLEEQNEELLEVRYLLNSIPSSVSDLMMVAGRDGRLEKESASLADVTGLSAETVVGDVAPDLFESAASAVDDRVGGDAICAGARSVRCGPEEQGGSAALSYASTSGRMTWLSSTVSSAIKRLVGMLVSEQLARIC